MGNFSHLFTFIDSFPLWFHQNLGLYLWYLSCCYHFLFFFSVCKKINKSTRRIRSQFKNETLKRKLARQKRNNILLITMSMVFLLLWAPLTVFNITFKNDQNMWVRMLLIKQAFMVAAWGLLWASYSVCNFDLTPY